MPPQAVLTSVGQTVSLSAQVFDQDNGPMIGADVNWQCSDVSVATVNASGLVRAVGPGTATITARTGAVSASIAVEVLGEEDPADPVLQEERNILMHFYTETDGVKWTRDTNWSSDEPLGNWHGITTNAAGRITGISLENNNLNGPLPSELAGLTELRKLNLSRNDKLSGLLPQAFVVLSFDELQLEGTGVCTPSSVINTDWFVNWLNAISIKSVSICQEDLDLATLEALFELFNKTDGRHWNNRTNWNSARPFGEWYGVKTDESGQIIELNLADNNLVGFLPSELAKLTYLERMNLSGNEGLHGVIPQAFTELDLSRLLLDGTKVCATTDSAIQSWLTEIPMYSVSTCIEFSPEWHVLAALYFTTDGPYWINDTNWLSEKPLSTWHGVTLDADGSVSKLGLAYNGLTGPIPPELSQLSELSYLDLSGNRLSGPIPPELSQLSELSYLDLFGNRLSGPIPPELGQLSKLSSIDLSFNGLTGPIPPELSRLSELSYLKLSINRLSGPIPPELGQLSRLTTISLSQNSLSGPIPPELSQLSELFSLDLYRNRLSGPIPPELSQLSKLFELNLGQNRFSGPIPPGLGQLSRLTTISLGQNGLSGPIPPELGELNGLYWLDLSGNGLSGPAPPELGEINVLAHVDLSSNPRLSGPLPLSFTKLSLDVLHLAGTELCVPATERFRAWFSSIRQGNFRVCIDKMATNAYLTQATQSFTRPVPLVAGEAALLRVFITTSSGEFMTKPPVRATFYQDSRVVHTVDIPGGETTVPADIDEGSLTRSSNAVIPGSVVAPGLEMVIHIDPEGLMDSEEGMANRIPAMGRSPIDVRSVPRLDLTLVPFLWLEDPDFAGLAYIDGLSAEDELFRKTRDLLPIRDFDVEVREPVWTTSSGSNSNEILQETMAIRIIDDSNRYYMGILNEYGAGGEAELPGYSSVSELHGEIVAHELGHNLSLRHTDCGGADGTDPFYPYSGGSVGSWGYDFSTGSLVGPGAADLMSYCRPQWIGDYGFGRALNYRQSLSPAFASRAVSKQKSLLIWGGVSVSGELSIEPAFVVDTTPFLPERTGPYRLAGESADGNVLFELEFGMSELADRGGNAFAFALPILRDWPGSLHRIILSGPEGAMQIDRDDGRSAALLMDRNAGMAKGILRDWPAPADVSPAGRRILPEPGLDVMVSPGIPDAEFW